MAQLGTIRPLHPYYKVEGVDVSKWQGLINWNKLINYMDFVYIRAGDAGIHPSWKDSQFDTNWQAVRRLNVPHGAYWFFRTDKSPVEQADRFADFMGGWYGNLPPVIDVEKNDAKLSPTDLDRAVNQFMDRIKQRTLKECGLYTSWGFSSNFGSGINITPSRMLWVAQYTDYATEPKLPRGWTRWDIWQKEADNNGVYNTGLAMGVQSRAIDRNVFRGDASAFQSRFGVRLRARGGVTLDKMPKFFTPKGNLQLRSGPSNLSKSRGQVFALNKFRVFGVEKDKDGNIWYRIGPDMFLAGWEGTPEF